MISPEDISLFDQYLRGELSKNEREAFENSLKLSKALQVKFDQYKKDATLIHLAFEYDEIKDTLKSTHHNLYTKKRKSRLIKPTFLIGLGAAAGIAILLTLNTFNSSFLKNENATAYQELSNEDEDNYIEQTPLPEADSANETKKHLDSLTLKNNLTFKRGTPKGTSFLINGNGYFFTAKHLVQQRNTVTLQQKESQLTFEAAVIYVDSIADFAILKCDDSIADLFEKNPFQFLSTDTDLGDEVFTLGYSKRDVVYTKGVVSSETGFESDSMYMEISLPSNAGNSGAPLFNMNGKLVGLITANHANKQSVTYALKHSYLKNYIDTSAAIPSIKMTQNRSPRHQKIGKLIKIYRTYIFEVH